MIYNSGVSEIIGVILLIGIIVAASGIFAAIYLPQIKPTTIPNIQLSIACSSNSTLVDGNTIEYPCTHGSFSCYPPDDPFDKQMCEKDCQLRYYSHNPQYNSNNREREILRCMENCVIPICSDLGKCRVLYICHNGGDILDSTNLNIFINGNELPIDQWEIKSVSDNFTEYKPVDINKKFGIGASLRAATPSDHVDTVMVTYTLPSGEDIPLVLNQFGTDID